MERNTFNEEILEDNCGLFSYKVFFEESDINDLKESINQYLNGKFDNNKISEFNGNVAFNLILSDEYNLEQEFNDSLISNETIEKITAWIEVTKKDFILEFSVNDENICTLILNEKTIKKGRKKDKEQGGCFLSLLKFVYYLFLLTIFLIGGVFIQEGKINLGIRTICLSLFILFIPTIISSSRNKKKHKQKK